MNSIKPYIPNCITLLRIIGTLALFFTKPLSDSFYILYTLTGVTDVLDGYFARRWKTASDFGAKLDSVADLTFYFTVIIRLLPVLLRRLPKWIWFFAAVMAAVRIASYVTVAVKFRRFASSHTWGNKATGLMVFFLIYVLPFWFASVYSVVLCAVGTLAALEELIIHIREKEYRTNVKSCLAFKKQINP